MAENEAADRLLRQELGGRVASIVSPTQQEAVFKHKESLCYLQDQYTIRSSQCEKRYGDALAQVDALGVEMENERHRHRYEFNEKYNSIFICFSMFSISRR